MRHTNFEYPHPCNMETNQQLRREEGAIRLHADSAQRITVKKFCCTVNVANPEPEPDAICKAIHRGVGQAQQRVGTPNSITDDHGSAIRCSSFDKERQVGDTELSVAVSEGEVLVARRRKSRSQSATIPTIHFVAHQANDPAVPLYEASSHSGSLVA